NEPHSREYLMAQGQTLHNLGNLCRNEKRWEDALTTYQAGRDAFMRILEDQPTDHATNYFLGGTLNNLADVLQHLDRPSEAIDVLGDAVRRGRVALDGRPTNATSRAQLVSSLETLARAYRISGQAKAADETTRERDRIRGESPKGSSAKTPEQEKRK